MQVTEALQRVISVAISADDGRSIDPDNKDYQDDQAAIAICQAILNTALPVARFRAFVQIDDIPGKQEGREYTVCAVSVPEIQQAVKYLAKVPLAVSVTLWEQKQAGAEMLSGYQGLTNPQYRKWVNSLIEFQDEQQAN